MDDLLTDLRKLADTRGSSIQGFQEYQDDDARELRRLVAGDLDTDTLGKIAALVVAMSGRRSFLTELSLGLAELSHLIDTFEASAIVGDTWGAES